MRRGLALRSDEPVKHLGIDEKSFLTRHQYVTVLVDLDRRRVLEVGEERKAESLEPWFAARTPAELAAIEAVVMDMWEPYRKMVRAYVADADRKIVFDKFHIVKHVTDAMDAVRKQEHAQLKAAGDTRLTGTTYLWLSAADTLTREAWEKLTALRTSTLKSARAWALKESFPQLWVYQYPVAAQRFFQWWHNWATHSRLAPMSKVARMLKAHLDNILTYLEHRVTNAVTEGLNAKIQWIKYAARGYRNPAAFRMAFLFHRGRLDLDPRAS